eukprot:CAMPEP_0198369484 /NCGR_PEP_ID=MMETSP1450-20131203/156229_1 /TAXON_ID=753684 ORGANISM="Madagascaria erythrocladiodes, Strain CCMP3234" /NCGR_SAMPLE_ID=MMETSP1450 /ASSEMBLY_ACC=CAM_ASM_001115 /LENGTH=286 /DNA_ID=CAMNT_0044077005 /DNA_START=3015 /DNA_END=3875 /DNA_ORIENTATION=+
MPQTVELDEDNNVARDDVSAVPQISTPEATQEMIERQETEDEALGLDLDMQAVGVDKEVMAALAASDEKPENDLMDFFKLNSPVGPLVDEILSGVALTDTPEVHSSPPHRETDRCHHVDIHWERLQYWIVTRYKTHFEDQIRSLNDIREVYSTWGNCGEEKNGRCLGHCHKRRKRRKKTRLPSGSFRRFCATKKRDETGICEYHWSALQVRSLSLRKGKLRVSDNLIRGKERTSGCSSRIEEHIATQTRVGKDRFLKLVDLQAVVCNEEHRNIAVLLEVKFPKREA